MKRVGIVPRHIKNLFGALAIIAWAFSSTSALGAPASVNSFPSIASMQALGASSSFYPTIQVIGYYAGSVVGGGTFNWQIPASANKNCTADSGTVFLASGVSSATGCWVRQLYGNSYLASWFGATTVLTNTPPSSGTETANAASLQAGLNAAFAANYAFQLDVCARYFINATLTVPAGSFNYNGYTFKFTGCDAGVAYATNPLAFGSVLAMDPSMDRTLFSFQDPQTHLAGSTGEVSGIRFEGTTTSQLVFFKVMTFHFEFRNNQLVQAGTGFGFSCDGCGNSTIANNFAIATATNTSVGFKVSTSINFGLMNINNNTSRGFAVCYQLGGGGGSQLGLTATKNESSGCGTGFQVSVLTEGAILDSNYFEGITGTDIVDNGDFTKVLNSYSNETSVKFIDNTGTTTVGNVYQNNYISRSGATADGTPQATTYIDVLDNGASTSTGKIISGNLLNLSGSVCGGPCPNVTGIKITGAAPRLSMTPYNLFFPVSAWPGTASTQIDCSGITGTPVGQLQCTDAGIAIPITANLSSRLLVDADIAAGVLTLPGVSPQYQMTLSGGATNITSFATTNIVQGAYVCIESTNASPTFVAGAGILRSASYTPTAAGGSLCGYFTIDGGNAIFHSISASNH